MGKKYSLISKQKIFLLIIFLTILIMVIIEAKFISLNYFNKIKTENLSNQCELEWEKLNENVYFRKNLAFYYSDINKIQIYFERNKNFQFKYKLLIKVFGEKNFFYHFINIVNSHTLRTDGEYVFEFLESDFNIRQLNLSKNVNEKFSLTAKIQVLNIPLISTQKSINLIIKNFNTLSKLILDALLHIY